MPETTDPITEALRLASWAVGDLLEDLAGVSVAPDVRDRLVAAVVEICGDEGLILVRRDDLDAYVNREGEANMPREVEGLERLLDRLNETSKDAHA